MLPQDIVADDKTLYVVEREEAPGCFERYAARVALVSNHDPSLFVVSFADPVTEKAYPTMRAELISATRFLGPLEAPGALPLLKQKRALVKARKEAHRADQQVKRAQAALKTLRELKASEEVLAEVQALVSPLEREALRLQEEAQRLQESAGDPFSLATWRP